MDNITFDNLPAAVLKLTQKLEHIEELLLENQNITEQPEQDKLLTVQEAGEYLNLAVPTLYGLVSRCAIPVCKKGKRLYFSKMDLKAWIESGRKKSDTGLKQQVDRLLAPKG